MFHVRYHFFHFFLRRFRYGFVSQESLREFVEDLLLPSTDGSVLSVFLTKERQILSVARIEQDSIEVNLPITRRGSFQLDSLRASLERKQIDSAVVVQDWKTKKIGYLKVAVHGNPTIALLVVTVALHDIFNVHSEDLLEVYYEKGRPKLAKFLSK